MPSRDTRGTTLARGLRRNQTDAERLLWSRLRNRGLQGFTFDRQVSVPPYIADFVCEEARLIVEVDGGQHAETVEADAKRTDFFKKRGYTVTRFWNNDVLTNLDGVLEVILGCVTSPSPLTLSRWERGLYKAAHASWRRGR